MREEEFLDDQTRQAKSAIHATVSSLREDAMLIVDPRRLTREHPWKLLAVAVAAGFVASKLFVPEEPDIPEAPSRPSRLKRALKLSRILAVAREIVAVSRPIVDTLWAAALAAADGHHTNGDHLSQTPSDEPPNSPPQS